jgi:hypothetical protein
MPADNRFRSMLPVGRLARRNMIEPTVRCWPAAEGNARVVEVAPDNEAPRLTSSSAHGLFVPPEPRGGATQRQSRHSRARRCVGTAFAVRSNYAIRRRAEFFVCTVCVFTTRSTPSKVTAPLFRRTQPAYGFGKCAGMMSAFRLTLRSTTRRRVSIVSSRLSQPETRQPLGRSEPGHGR